MTSRSGRGAVVLTAALFAAALLAGCSGSDSGTPDGDGVSAGDAAPGRSGDGTTLTAREQEYADAVVAPMQAQSDTPLADDEARCFSEGAVRVLGAEVLARGGTPAEAGRLFSYFDLSSLDIDEATAQDVVAVLDTCGIDLRGDAIAAARTDVSPQAADCIADNVDADDYRAMLVTQFHRGVEAYERDVLDAEAKSGLDAGQQTWVTFAGCVVDHMPAP